MVVLTDQELQELQYRAEQCAEFYGSTESFNYSQDVPRLLDEIKRLRKIEALAHKAASNYCDAGIGPLSHYTSKVLYELLELTEDLR